MVGFNNLTLMDKNGNQTTTPIDDRPKQEDYPYLLRGNSPGRPTKYTDSMVKQAEDYIDKVMNLRDKKRLLPTVEGLAGYLGVDADSVIAWATKRVKDDKGNVTKQLARPAFFGAVKRIKELQKQMLITDGLYGGKEVNAVMAIFLLKVNHGLIDSTNVDHTTKGKELPTPILGGATNVSKDNSTQ